LVEFLVFGAMAAAAVLLLVLPLMRRNRPGAARAAYDLEVYRDQLGELDADAARGLIAPDQHATARREVERRILGLDLAPLAWAAEDRGAVRRVAVATGVAIAVPLAAGALYLGVGAPGLRDQPLAARPEAAGRLAGADGQQAGSVEEMTAKLAQRLEREPDDLEGWVLLGRSYGALGRFDEAVAALRRAAELGGGSPDALAMLAEHVVFAADGIVTPEAKALFERVRAARPDDPAASFYLGLQLEQAGRHREALELWSELAARSAPDAPWLADLRERIAAAAAALGEDPEAYLAPAAVPSGPASGTGPTAEDIAAATEMSADEQADMIRGMVEGLAARLEAEPEDAEGWRRLGRAYQVLGERAKSRDAYAQAAIRRPDDLGAVQAYAEAMVVAADGAVPDGAVLLYRRLLAADGANPGALWHLGLAAANAGDRTGARELWQRLLATLPEDSPDRAFVRERLDALEDAG
jgi:cytochrome c-type biogenesis protein CcmH